MAETSADLSCQKCIFSIVDFAAAAAAAAAATLSAE